MVDEGSISQSQAITYPLLLAQAELSLSYTILVSSGSLGTNGMLNTLVSMMTRKTPVLWVFLSTRFARSGTRAIRIITWFARSRRVKVGVLVGHTRSCQQNGQTVFSQGAGGEKQTSSSAVTLLSRALLGILARNREWA